MPKLFSRKMYRVYCVSERPGRYSLHRLVKFKKTAFNKEIDEDKLQDTLTDLATDLFGHTAGCQCIEIDDTDAVSEEETLYLKIDGMSRLEIRNIINSIDLNVDESVIFRYYILVNTIRKKCEWVVAFEHTVYSDCEKRHEEPKWSNTDDDPDAYLEFVNALNGH